MLLCCVPKTAQVNLSSSAQTQPKSGTARPCPGLDSLGLAHAEEPKGVCIVLANASTLSGPPRVHYLLAQAQCCPHALAEVLSLS